ncbi:MAG: hypothetical protein IT368_08635 [Candidatus Hydrogenedentes bacterium]|nr:hypothetical protein [Candidatus Hydrogenedentota bacterium]
MHRASHLLAVLAVLAHTAAGGPLGRYADHTRDWEPVGSDLLSGFDNMYNLHVIEECDADYPFRGWFFGWAVEDCNPGYPGCDAIYTARAKSLAGPWEVYGGEQDGAAVWDASGDPRQWVPVITGGNVYYNNWHNGDPSVVKHEGGYYMAYSATGHNLDGIPFGSPGDTDSDISCVMGATSDDGLHWTTTPAPLLVHPENIGGAPAAPGEYAHPRGLYHRPSLMRDEGKWKLWFDAIILGKPACMLYAENAGDFADPAEWKIIRGLENPCIWEFPNPDVVKVQDLYFAFGDPGGHFEEGWANRKVTWAVSRNGVDWRLLGYMEPDGDVQANHVPEALIREEAGTPWLYVFYAGQRFEDYRYRCIRAKRLALTEEKRAEFRAACDDIGVTAAPFVRRQR